MVTLGHTIGESQLLMWLFARSFRRLLDLVMRRAGPGLGGLEDIRAGHDTAVGHHGLGHDGGVEIACVKGGGPLRLRDRFSRERDRLNDRDRKDNACR